MLSQRPGKPFTPRAVVCKSSFFPISEICICKAHPIKSSRACPTVEETKPKFRQYMGLTFFLLFPSSVSQGVVTDNSYQTDQNTCQTDSKSDLTVRVSMDGSWGAETGATQSDMRAAMVSTMWSSIEAIWAQNQYTVYGGCAGLTWQEAVDYSSSAPCGPQSAVSCSDACSSAASTTYLVQCDTATVASKLPSTLKVTAYESGTLLADELTVTFAATANDISDGGCGIVGTISEQLASFIPVVGGVFSAGIAFQCGE